jgi:hypothetical protein
MHSLFEKENLGQCRATHLGRDNEVIPLPAKKFYGPAHDLLGITRTVGFGGVEEVDARVVGSLEAGECLL